MILIPVQVMIFQGVPIIKIYSGGYKMIWKYLLIMLISMIPIVELRGAVPIGIGMGLHPIVTIIVCVIGNMLPVPIIHIFARKFLLWGSKQKIIGKFCGFFIRKGERASAKLLNNISNLKILKSWVTTQYKSDTKFINFIIRKNK